jgi:hypothetical protein
MIIYKLTVEERAAIEALSALRTNILLIVCDLGGETGCAVVYADLISELYADYRTLLSETLDPERIVDVDVDPLF